MKKLFFILALFISLFAEAQKAVYLPSNEVIHDSDFIWRRSGLWHTITIQEVRDLINTGSSGGGGSFDTTGVFIDYQNAINARQLLNDNLTVLSSLTPTTDNFIVSVANNWASRTPAQVKSLLALESVENIALSTWNGSTAITILGNVTTGSIPLANVTGLQAALNNKINYTDSSNMLLAYRNALNNRSLIGHTHTFSDISGTTGSYIQNQTAVVQDATFAITGPIKIGSITPVDTRMDLFIKNNDSTNNGFALAEFKTFGDKDDLNMDGLAIVKHSRRYSLTGGYGDAAQFYKLAGSRGFIIGDNSFEGVDAMSTYTPGYNEKADGWIAFELGPRQPKSEIFRFNNRGDKIFGWNNLRNYVASQTGNIVTDPINSFFPTDVGKWFVWSNEGAGGKFRYADRITGYTDANHITVETNRTVESQGGRVADAWAYVDTIGNARFKIMLVDSLRIGDENAGYYRFVPSSASLKLLRVGSSSPDTLFDISGINRLLTGRDIEMNGSHQSQLTMKSTGTTRYILKADAVSVAQSISGNIPYTTTINGALTNTFGSTGNWFHQPLIVGTSSTPASIGNLDVYNTTKTNSAYIENSGAATAVRRGMIITRSGTNTADNIGLYINNDGSATDKGLQFPSNFGGNSVGDRVISNESSSPIFSSGSIITENRFRAINTPAGTTTVDSVAKFNRSTGDLEQVKFDTSRTDIATALNARSLIGHTHAGYLATTDSASMLAAYQTAINARFKYTDSTAMLAAYQIALNSRLKITDTTSMLAAYITALNARQATLVSGTNIKTVNNNNLLGSGNIDLLPDEILTLQSLGSAAISQTFGAFSPSWITTSAVLVDNSLFGVPVKLYAGQTVTGIKWWQVAQGSYTADQTNNVSLFSLVSGSLTKVAESTNDGNIWKATANSWNSVAFTSTYAVTTTGVYWVGLLYNNSAQTTAPSIGCIPNSTNSGVTTGDMSNKLHFSKAPTNAPASSFTMSGTTASTVRQYLIVY